MEKEMLFLANYLQNLCISTFLVYDSLNLWASLILENYTLTFLIYSNKL